MHDQVRCSGAAASGISVFPSDATLCPIGAGQTQCELHSKLGSWAMGGAGPGIWSISEVSEDSTGPLQAGSDWEGEPAPRRHK